MNTIMMQKQNGQWVGTYEGHLAIRYALNSAMRRDLVNYIMQAVQRDMKTFTLGDVQVEISL